MTALEQAKQIKAKFSDLIFEPVEFRGEVTIPMAFKVARKALDDSSLIVERALRREAAMEFRRSTP